MFAWGQYSGALKRAIAALKFENNPFLARPLGHQMAQMWLTAQQPVAKVTVVPIPMHISKNSSVASTRQSYWPRASVKPPAFPYSRKV